MPVIASGGAGDASHVADALEVAQAALLASILHEDPGAARIAARRAARARGGARDDLSEPAIVQDAATGRVLMLAWMDDEAERLTRETSEAWFWSRSREQLWRKGETSGNTLAVDELRDDCDGDAHPRCASRPAGPACHTGSTHVLRAGALAHDRGAGGSSGPPGSYTAELLDEGVGACARKVGEEAVELTVAALDETDERVVEEAADLVYHLYVLLGGPRRLDVAQVEDELRLRSSG